MALEQTTQVPDEEISPSDGEHQERSNAEQERKASQRQERAYNALVKGIQAVPEIASSEAIDEIMFLNNDRSETSINYADYTSDHGDYRFAKPIALSGDKGEIIAIKRMDAGMCTCTIRLSDGTTQEIPSIPADILIGATMRANASVIREQLPEGARSLLDTFTRSIEDTTVFQDDNTDILLTSAENAIAERTLDQHKTQVASNSEFREGDTLRKADAILAAELTSTREHISRIQAQIKNGELSESARGLITDLEEKQRQLAIAVNLEGQAGTAFKRRALATLKKNTEATGLAAQLTPAADEAEGNMVAILKEHGMDEAALKEMEGLFKSGDIEGLAKRVKSLKTADAAMQQLFGESLNDEKKIGALLDKAGYSKEEKDKIKAVLAAGGFGLIGIIAIIVMGPLAANAQIAKMLAGKQG